MKREIACSFPASVGKRLLNPGALVEVWQANNSALYSLAPGLELRWKHDHGKGQYAFETIVPAPYLNGAQYRPRHPLQGERAGISNGGNAVVLRGDGRFIAANPWASQPERQNGSYHEPGGGVGMRRLRIVLDGFVGISRTDTVMMGT
ncbi:MAG: hypothetical protein IPO87_18945 [Flavobacteriales bacterium]|nr:hypothetical protein [Flavobacteriales bacterium]